MCPSHPLWSVVACLIAGYALVAFLARLDAWRAACRRERLVDEILTRHEQAQSRWVESPAVDHERRN